MKRFTAALVALTFVMLAAAPAFAQTEDVPTQFVDFEEFFIDGKPVIPIGQNYDFTRRAKFKRLGFIAKRSMKPKMMETVDQL